MATMIYPSNEAFSRSPILIGIKAGSGETLIDATIGVKIWTGDKTSVPATNDFTIYAESKDDETIIVDVSDLINPDHIHDTSVTSGNVLSPVGECLWINISGSYTLNTGSASIYPSTFAVFDGFHHFDENANGGSLPYILTDKPFTQITADMAIGIPVKRRGSDSLSYVTSFGEEVLLTPPNNANQSTNQVYYLAADPTSVEAEIQVVDDYSKYWIVYKNASDIEIARHEIRVVDQCKHEPIQILFVNKYGVLDQMTCFGRNNVTINTTSKEFKSQIGIDMITGVPVAPYMTYDTTAHQTSKLNVQSVKSIVLNTGFLTEGFSEVISQIMESESVWIVKNDVIIPVIATDSSQTLQQQVNERLINYTLNFRFANNQIGDIR